ncbi:MAG: hypothetical protein LW840_14025 [Gemmatimonas sp.]|jgi:hypothetical protein|uniref:hypothetical protein n=1 Tax=Gemmatimonas sp. TaxID=1962908 RepID=UPI0025BCE862|nr:hypothetical protein [Gemmatimonas sp.]MCE2954811.1 hypothetical protein [Gemmatimonas sp.]
MLNRAMFAAAAAVVLAAPAFAQPTQPPAKKDDHAAMHAEHMKQMQHGKDAKANAWKELDAYHGLMMATWHPAKDKNDMAPTRGMIGTMVTSAKAVAASKAPAACQKPELQKAQAGLVGETEKVQTLVNAKADDAALKTAMRALHDAFEVLEEGCNTGMKH